MRKGNLCDKSYPSISQGELDLQEEIGLLEATFLPRVSSKATTDAVDDEDGGGVMKCGLAAVAELAGVAGLTKWT